MFYDVAFKELDHADNLTGQDVLTVTCHALNKLEAQDKAVKLFKTEHPELYKEYRHSYVIEINPLETV